MKLSGSSMAASAGPVYVRRMYKVHDMYDCLPRSYVRKHESPSLGSIAISSSP